jgi:hypothetical protein
MHRFFHRKMCRHGQRVENNKKSPLFIAANFFAIDLSTQITGRVLQDISFYCVLTGLIVTASKKPTNRKS